MLRIFDDRKSVVLDKKWFAREAAADEKSNRNIDINLGHITEAILLSLTTKENRAAFYGFV